VLDLGENDDETLASIHQVVSSSGLEVFAVMKIKVVFFWIVRLYNDAVGYHRFGATWCLHLQGENIS
jgi:hypothetical protein